MRPKNFDPNAVLERAMHLFWEKGYEATSTQDLVDRMGINRSSLYNTFGSKHQLFLAAFEHYCQNVIGERLHILEVPGASLPAIREFFYAAQNWAEDFQGWQGCLVTNSAVERAPHDSDTAHFVERLLQRMENGLYRTLVAAQQKREISRSRDPRALARFLTNCLQGMAVTVKRSPDPEVMRDIVEITLSTLEPPGGLSSPLDPVGLSSNVPS